MKRTLTLVAAFWFALVPAAALRGQGTSISNVGWYNGDCTSGIPGWANWYTTNQNFSRVYEDFVVPAGGWKVTGVFSVNWMTATGVTSAAWEIRSGVSGGSGGTIVASGTGPATQTTVTNWKDGEVTYLIEIDGLNVQLASGTYWLSVSPVVDYTPSKTSAPPSYVCVTRGANATGNPMGNDGNSYFYSTATGADFEYLQSTGQAGFSGDFSLGVRVPSGPTVTLDVSPAPATFVGWYNGDCQSGIPGWANWYSGIQQFSRIYDDFTVPSGGWNVAGVFSINSMAVKGVTAAAWEIRSGLSSGNSGTAVASGISPAIQTLVDTWPDGENIYRIEVDGLSVQLPAGRYWLSVSPVVPSSQTTQSYVCATRGTDAIGNPPGNDGNAFFDSLAVPGNNYVNIKSSGGAGVSGDYSMGLLIPSGLAAPVKPAVAGVANAASWRSGAVSPGEIVSIMGTGLGPSTASTLALDPSGTVSTSLDGVQVFFNGVAAPETYVGTNQINAVVPYEVAGMSNVSVTVVAAGQTSNAFPVTVAEAAPALFTSDGSGGGQAAILNQDYTYNGPSHPAAKGSYVVLFLTGEGQTTSPVTGGITAVAATAPWTPQPLLPVTVVVGGQPASVAFYGEAPNLVAGVMQVNVQIPTNVPSGDLPITVAVGTNGTPSGVTVSVQ